MNLKQLKKDLRITPYICVSYYEEDHLLKETVGRLVNYIDIHGLIDYYDDRIVAHVEGSEDWVSMFSDGKIYRTRCYEGILEAETFLGKVKSWTNYAI